MGALSMSPQFDIATHCSALLASGQWRAGPSFVHESVTRQCYRAPLGAPHWELPRLSKANGQRQSAPPFHPDQIEAMHRALEQVRTRLRLTGAKAMPVVELLAIRIVELAHAGEFDPDKLTERLLAEFDV
jgi:hypothetical protein